MPYAIQTKDKADHEHVRAQARPAHLEYLTANQHKLLAGAIDYARDKGVRMLEAYPVDKPERSHDDFMFFGSRSLYERAGFKEVVRRSPTRLVMRRGLRARRKP